MKKQIKNLLGIILIIFVNVHPVLSQDKVYNFNDFKLSDQFSKVHIGMSLKEFTDANDIKKLSVFNSENEYISKILDKQGATQVDISLVQKFRRNDLYSFAVYIFKHGVLSGVNIGNSIPGHLWDSRLPAYLNSILKYYGQPQLIGVSELVTAGRAPTKTPVLIWKKGDACVILRYNPLITKHPEDNIIDLIIGKKSVIQSDAFIKNFLPVVPDDENNIIKPIVSQIKNLFPLENQAFSIIRQPIEVEKPLLNTMSNRINRDFSPTWGASENIIYFFTTRELIGDNITHPKSLSALLAKDNSKRFKVVYSKDESIHGLFEVNELSSFPTFSTVSKRLAFESDDSIFILDTKSYSLGRVNDGKRVYRNMPSWNSKGNALVMSGIHSLSDRKDKNYLYDVDIFVTQVPEKLSIASSEKSWCPARIVGEDILPIFSLDDQFIYFAHQEFGASNAISNDIPISNWAIYRVNAEKHFTINQPAEKVVGDLPLPERLSWFPDGKNLFISFYNEENLSATRKIEYRPPVMLNVITQTSKELMKEFIQNPHFNNGEILFPREIVLNNSGTRLLFSAYSWAQAKSIGESFIYSSNLDGEKLQRITMPNMRYTSEDYPFEGIAFSNAWQKLMPNYNMGSEMVRNNSEARARIIEKNNMLREAEKARTGEAQVGKDPTSKPGPPATVAQP